MITTLIVLGIAVIIFFVVGLTKGLRKKRQKLIRLLAEKRARYDKQMSPVERSFKELLPPHLQDGPYFNHSKPYPLNLRSRTVDEEPIKTHVSSSDNLMDTFFIADAFSNVGSSDTSTSSNNSFSGFGGGDTSGGGSSGSWDTPSSSYDSGSSYSSDSSSSSFDSDSSGSSDF